MAVTVYQPNATLMAVGAQWLFVSNVCHSPKLELAILAKRPGPHALKFRCERHRDLLLSYGVSRYADLPIDHFVATAKILSRKRIPSRHHDPEFWQAVDSQLHLIDEFEKGMYAYRLSVEAIRPVPYQTTWSTFKICRSILEGS